MSRTKFIVLFQGRAGSTYLMDVLSKHPDLVTKGEMLVRYARLLNSVNHRGPLEKLKVTIRSLWKGSPAEQQTQAVKRFYDRKRENTIAVGFKSKVKDILDLAGMKEVLESRRVKVVVMQRQNLVKQAISHIAAFRLYDKTGEWNLYDEKDRVNSMHISVDEFDRMLRKAIFQDRMLNAYVDWLDLPKLRVEYADLLRDKTAWFQQIFDFLGVQPCNLDSRVRKNSAEEIRKVISNFEELKKTYLQTEFGPMFDEVVIPGN